MNDGLEVLPVRGIGDVVPGADLASEITTAAPWLRDGDVLVVTSKIISKAEGQLVDVPVEGPEREAAREETLLAETARPVARRGRTRIVQTHHGFVMASAGIDASNVDRSRLVLLPKDPDASARSLRAALRERFGLDVAIIVSDTMGRPWRNGLTDVALGAAGIPALRDHRGETDPYGNELRITQMAIADELCAAAELVKGKCDQVPVAVVRGYLSAGERPDGPGAAVLVRDGAHDMFSLGTAEARAAGLSHAASLPVAELFAEPAPPESPDEDEVPPLPLGRDVVERALAVAATAPTTTVAVEETGATLVITLAPTDATSPAQLVELGVDLLRVRAALAAAGLASQRLAPTALTQRLAVGRALR